MRIEKLLSQLQSVLEYRHLPAVVAAVAVIIMLPALNAGLLWDDLAHRTTLVEPSQLPERLLDTGVVPANTGRLSTVVSNQFVFQRDTGSIARYKDYGVMPWWTSDDLQISFWRPLTSFTHWLDYRLFPNSPAMMHAHNLVWFATVILLVTMLYRQLMVPGWLAGLAALLYLLDENNYFPATWIAQRNVLLALVFGVLCLLAHHHWRQRRSLPAAVTAPLLLLLSLLSAEAGIATFAYLFAYALAIDPARWPQRGLSLVPAVIVIVLWRIVYTALGYGVHGSGLYVDPVSEPLQYASAVLRRAPILLMGQLGWQTPDLLYFVRDSAVALAWIISMAFLLVVFVAVLPLLRKDRVARFWFTAMLLSVLPICAILPSTRNLLFVGIAAFGLVAQFIGGVLTTPSWLQIPRLRLALARGLCAVLLLVHLPMAAVSRIVAPTAAFFILDSARLGAEVDSLPGLERQDLVLVNAPNPLALVYFPFARAYEGKPLPQAVRCLGPGYKAWEILRTDERTLVFRAQSGNLFSCNQESPLHLAYFFKVGSSLFCSDRFAPKVGQRTVLTHMTVEIIDADADGLPTKFSFRFPVPLHDPSLRWLQFSWETDSYRPFKPPAVGERAEIAGPPPVSFRDAVEYVVSNMIRSE